MMRRSTTTQTTTLTTTLTTSSCKPRAALGAIGLSLILHAGIASAQSSTTDRATAEALFQQGTELMAAKQYAKACEKFEGSHELDPALGTTLRLADCYDRSGKTASAWAMFRDAASIAHRRAELDRQQIANERAADLEKRLSKIVLKVDAKNRPADLEIRLNGSLIPRTTWDAPIPVDPGRQRVEASAPGRVAWSGALDIAEGTRVATLDVPALDPKGPELEAHAAATLGQPSATGADAPAPRGSAQRAMGYVTGGLGVVGLLAGGYFSYRAYDFKQKSLDDCRVNDPNACTQAGKDLRDQAKSSAAGATVAIAAGGVLLASGITLIVLSPHGDTRRGGVGQLRFSPNPSALGGTVRFEGVW